MNKLVSTRHFRGVFILATSIMLVSGCHTEQEDLTGVNKEWDKVIRASHIYPIYPLTEDLIPGDIFWVSKRINDSSQWNQPGYLALDRMIARIEVTNYTRFYSNEFSYGESVIPKVFMDAVNWSNSPGAAFPSYGFTVQQDVGANVSLPIQGIPVGLALMGAKSASGQVAITEAHTYGIDELDLKDAVKMFISNHVDYLLGLLRDDGLGTNYLQVVTRVYTAQRVAVSLFKESGIGMTASGGMPKDVPLPELSTNTAQSYSNLVNAVNGIVASNETAFSAAAGLAPGGTLKFTSINSSSVSMDQQFPRPLVIGYLGFNVEISRKSLDDITSKMARGETWTLPYATRNKALRFQQSQ